MVPAHWWRTPPFLPVPARGYLQFRLLTQYGSASAVPSTDDLVSYLEWCRRQHQSVRMVSRGTKPLPRRPRADH